MSEHPGRTLLSVAAIALGVALGEGVETIIAGGFDRGVDMTPVGPAIAASGVKNLILFPTTGEKIWRSTVAAAPGTASSPTLSIAISCVGRRLVLGERTEEEVEAVFDVLPKVAQQIGFYSYGEISPYSTGHCDLHNQTMTLTTISEAA